MAGGTVTLRPAGGGPPAGATTSYDVLDGAGRRVGSAALTRRDEPGAATLAGHLDPAARGAGLGACALDALLDLAWRPADDGGLGLARVDVAVDADDRPALRLLRRAGFRTVGTLRPASPAPAGTSGAGAFGAGTVVLERCRADDPPARDDPRVAPLVLPTLRTPHLVLRAFGDEDAPGPDEGPDGDSHRFLPAGAHPDATTYTAWLARARRRQDAGQALTWAVTRAGEDHPLGYVVLFGLDPAEAGGGGQAELGYLLYPPARGRRVLPEAVAAVVRHGLAPVAEGGLGLRRLHAATDVDNRASQALLRGAGFRCWGTDHAAWRGADGRPSDGAYFELLADDDPTPAGLRLPRLEGLRVRLRPVVAGDLPRVVEGCTDPVTRLWLADLPDPYTLDSAARYLARTREQAASGNGVFLGVADPVDDRLLGAAALMGLRTTPGQAEVGYWTHPDERGRGVMTEAVSLLLRHAFAPVDEGGLGLRRLVLRAAEGNAPSLAVARATGFVRTGLSRRAERLGDGRHVDLIDHDLLVQEWDARPDGR